MIVARDLHIRYGDVHAVRGLSLAVEPGEVMGILGGNGAGKSSTLRALSGVNPASSGTVTIGDQDLSTLDGLNAARRVLGYCPDVGGLVRQATVREHLGLALAVRGQTDRWPAATTLVDEFGLTDVFDRVTTGFSHGMSRRLSVLLATLTAEKALILDEPFDGVDPTGVAATFRTIERAKDADVACVISTHMLDLLVRASDRITVMVDGTARFVGPAETFAGTEGAAMYEDLLRGTA